MKAWKIVLIFAMIVYGSLYAYTFHLSPAVKEKSFEEWIKIEENKRISFLQSDVCRECHLKVYRIWMSGNHSSVECEVCHGAGAEHAKLRVKESIVVEKSRDFCLICHGEISGRTAISVVSEGHGSGVICTYCHDPHR
uniref:Cytochrome c-552/4 domain-containing protein n=1 Tax=Archaeoglobus fulgidus TaxID=2234 RepID=A0A7J2TJM1_ARCFL